MAAKEISVKKYVVRLSVEEWEQLEAVIRKGKSAAQRLLKARILLKADVSEAGEGWSDNRIIKALETSASMVYRVRKQLVEEGFEAVLSRKQRATPAVARIFDGEKEAKLIALCRAPLVANYTAKACPIPEPAPVIATTLLYRTCKPLRSITPPSDFHGRPEHVRRRAAAEFLAPLGIFTAAAVPHEHRRPQECARIDPAPRHAG